MKKLVHCPRCREEIKESEMIDIDIVNGLTHKKCGPIERVKDTGTFKEIIQRYPCVVVKYSL